MSKINGDKARQNRRDRARARMRQRMRQMMKATNPAKPAASAKKTG